MEEQKLEIKYLPIESLIEYDGNARTHSNEQVEEICRSIQKRGWTNPILLDSAKGIVAGHGRLLAAKRLGLKEVPTIDLSFKTDAEKAEYIIADNKLALKAGWNLDILNVQFDYLEDAGHDLTDTGFDLDEINDIRIKEIEGYSDPDDVPSVQAEAITKMGDIWILGQHRLMCGDSTIIDTVERLMNGEKADMVFTDPPYGIKRDKGFGGFDGFSGDGKPIKRRRYENDKWDSDIPPKELFDLMLQTAEKILIFGGNFFAHLLPQGKHWIVWDKKNTMPTFGDAELIWTNIPRDSVKIKHHQYNGLIGKEKERFHPTQKPVALIEELINDYSESNDVVLDLFGGSGSILIACEKTNRKCFMMEISPVYCDVIIRRWMKFTQKQAILESTKQTFDEIENGYTRS